MAPLLLKVKILPYIFDAWLTTIRKKIIFFIFRKKEKDILDINGFDYLF
jgi:hypothetical protein